MTSDDSPSSEVILWSPQKQQTHRNLLSYIENKAEITEVGMLCFPTNKFFANEDVSIQHEIGPMPKLTTVMNCYVNDGNFAFTNKFPSFT